MPETAKLRRSAMFIVTAPQEAPSPVGAACPAFLSRVAPCSALSIPGFVQRSETNAKQGIGRTGSDLKCRVDEEFLQSGNGMFSIRPQDYKTVKDVQILRIVFHGLNKRRNGLGSKTLHEPLQSECCWTTTGAFSAQNIGATTRPLQQIANSVGPDLV